DHHLRDMRLYFAVERKDVLAPLDPLHRAQLEHDIIRIEPPETAEIIRVECRHVGTEIILRHPLSPTIILSIRRVPPIRAATSRRAGASPSRPSGSRLSASASTA